MRLIIIFSQFFLHILRHVIDEILRTKGSREEKKMERTTDIQLFSRESFTINRDSFEEIKIIRIQSFEVIEKVL